MANRTAQSDSPTPNPAGSGARFAQRTRYVLRAMAFLRPRLRMVLGAYAAMLVSNAVAVWMPLIIRHIVDDGIRTYVPGVIAFGCGLLLALAVVRGFCTFLTGLWTETASQDVAFDMRNRFHEKIQSLSFRFHDEAETGQLLARSVSDVDRVRFLTGRAFLHLAQMLTLVGGTGAAMVAIHAGLGALTLALIPLIVVCAIFLGSVLRPLSMRIRDAEADLTSFLEQNLRGSRVVKAFGREEAETQAFTRRNGDLLALQWREAKLRALYLPFMQLLAAAGILFVLVAGGRFVMDGALTLGELVAFTAYVAQLVEPSRRFGWMIAAVAQASASAERLFEVLDLKSDVEDAPDAVPLRIPRGEVRFEGVRFAYAGGRTVLDGVSFEACPGERVALLGGTGSGKTSVVNLIPRFYDPTAGVVSIDGVDVRRVTLKSLREQVGVVLQDAVLFASTIRENIAFGIPDASDDRIVAAAKAARAHDFIVELERGYDTPVGEKGVSLSGGQKQRLTIARAILKNPCILILDDATSSVDTETEEKIRHALGELMRGRTSFVIAHRLSTVREADKVLVLDRGRIVATGIRTPDETPHDMLLRTSGLYADIYYGQLRPAELMHAGTDADEPAKEEAP